MPNFFGLPYIDIRVSFNSFIPAALSEKIAGRLVDYYSSRLVKKPFLHDKIEFEIVFSCYTLDLEHRIQCLDKEGFSESDKEEICESLRNLTNKIIHPEYGLWKEDSYKLETLQDRREKLYLSECDTLEKIYYC